MKKITKAELLKHRIIVKKAYRAEKKRIRAEEKKIEKIKHDLKLLMRRIDREEKK